MRIVNAPKELQPIGDENTNAPGRALSEAGSQLRDFDLDEVDTVLGVLALNAGNINKTVRQVEAEHDIKLHPNTLTRWRKVLFPKRYTELQGALTTKLDKTVTDKLSMSLARGTQILEDMFDLIDERLEDEPDIPLKELAPALRNIAQANQLNAQQRNLLLEKPTQIVETRTVENTIKELEQEGIIVDAEVVED